MMQKNKVGFKEKLMVFLRFLSFLILTAFGSYLVYDLKSDIQVINHKADQFQQAGRILIEENGKLKSFAFDICKDTNVLGQYLMLEEKDCSQFFPEFFVNDYDLNIKSEFIALVDVFLIDEQVNQDLIDHILSIYGLADQAPSGSLETNKNNELPLIYKDGNLVKYLSDYNLAIEMPSDSLLHITQESTPVADVFWDEKDRLIKVNLLLKQKIINLEGFSKIKKEASVKLAEKNQFDLKAFLENTKKLETNISAKNNYLLLGRNGSNVDTIIFANIDHNKKRISLVSLPRDLWVDSRRINAFHALFGMEVFVDKLEEVLGQNISNYIMVDMMLFARVVDELGGVEYQFDKPLIDPFYRTVDNGVEGTLYYPVGKVQLDGIEALRVARSRQTTSDFSRAERQQKLLSAIKYKVSTIGTVRSLAKMIEPVMQYVKTDMKLYEILPLVFKVKDYELRVGNIISTGNILHSEMLEVDGGKKAYILRPRDNDWDLIKKFILQAIYRD